MTDGFEFDELDEAPAFGGPRKTGPADTRSLRYSPCDVCGFRLFLEEGDDPRSVCSMCRERMAATVGDLLLRGRGLPKGDDSSDR